MGETIPVCPFCDGHKIRKRNPEKYGAPVKEPDKKWWCWKCKKGFHEPDRRERKSVNPGQNYGVSAEAIQAAADALGVEGPDD